MHVQKFLVYKSGAFGDAFFSTLPARLASLALALRSLCGRFAFAHRWLFPYLVFTSFIPYTSCETRVRQSEKSKVDICPKLCMRSHLWQIFALVQAGANLT